jgi:pimeloyl-ACP methyl ester carboxylesterase
METKEHPSAALFLPGIIMPAVLRYAPLLRELGPGIEGRTKELEVYSLTPPPAEYSVGWEVEGLHEAARRAGLERFHLYGHSAGGAVSLAFTARHPEMVLSLTVDEPAFDFTDEGRAELGPTLELMDTLAANPGEAMPRFLRMELRPGVEFQPPSGSPPLPNRPAGVAALLKSFRTYRIDHHVLRRFGGPVLFTRGTLSNERYERSSRRLAGIFPRFREVVFEGLSHLNTSHQAEPARVAALLLEHWAADDHVGVEAGR